MVFRLARTFKQPGDVENSNRGFPAPGSGAQRTGYFPSPAALVAGAALPHVNRPTKGRRTFFNPAGGNSQRGFPAPLNAAQARPPGTWDPNAVYPDGLNHPVATPYYSRGANAVVQNYGKVLTNPIGAGVVAMHRPQASYGRSSEYHNGAIWWTSQAIPTTVQLQGLTSPEVLAAILGPLNVAAAIRVG